MICGQCGRDITPYDAGHACVGYAPVVFCKTQQSVADCLRAAQARVAELEAELRWTPVSERIPEHDDLVQVCWRDPDVWPARGHRQDYVRWDDGWMGRGGVTHWRPAGMLPDGLR